MALVATSVGATQARLLGEAHENYAGNDRIDKERDLRNNRIGRIIGKRLWHRRWTYSQFLNADGSRPASLRHNNLQDWVVRMVGRAVRQLWCVSPRGVVKCFPRLY